MIFDVDKEVFVLLLYMPDMAVVDKSPETADSGEGESKSSRERLAIFQNSERGVNTLM
jgi:hypothetical protein